MPDLPVTLRTCHPSSICLDPDVVVRIDAAALRSGAVKEILGARNWAKGVIPFSRQLKGVVQPMLINGEVGLVWAPRGRLSRVIRFSIADGRIATIDIIADRDRLRELEFAVLTA